MTEKGRKVYYLNTYIKDLVRIFDQNERKDYLRLDLNQNPGGLPDKFIKKILKKVTPQLISQYPETLHFTKVLADYLNTDVHLHRKMDVLLVLYPLILCFRFIRKCMEEIL